MSDDNGAGFYPEEDSPATPHARRREVKVIAPESRGDKKEIERQVQRKLAPVTSKISGVIEDLGSQARQLNAVMEKLGMLPAPDPDEQDKGRGMNPDVTWPCKKCGARLGYYDPNNGVLRTWMGGHRVRVHAGPGGWVQTICVSCSEENWIHYTATGDREGLPIVEDVITLDVPMLRNLLIAAEQSAHGYVEVPVIEASPDEASDPTPH